MGFSDLQKHFLDLQKKSKGSHVNNYYGLDHDICSRNKFYQQYMPISGGCLRKMEKVVCFLGWNVPHI